MGFRGDRCSWGRERKAAFSGSILVLLEMQRAERVLVCDLMFTAQAGVFPFLCL